MQALHILHLLHVACAACCFHRMLQFPTAQSVSSRIATDPSSLSQPLTGCGLFPCRHVPRVAHHQRPPAGLLLPVLSRRELRRPQVQLPQIPPTPNPPGANHPA